MSEDLGLAGIYGAFGAREAAAGSALDDVKGGDWRHILVLGRATKEGVYPETLALVGRARFLADELGCRVEVLLIGEELGKATEELKRYPLDTVYRVQAPDYAPIDHTAKVLEQVVRKRRPELVLVFQSRTGDAVLGFAANRLGVGFVTGASDIRLDTAERRAVAVHESGAARFQVVTAMQQPPQFISVQRGLFRAPLEDPAARVKVHDLKVEAGALAKVEVLERRPPAAATLATAERVVVAGARIQDAAELRLARDLAKRLGAAFGVTRGLVERGLAKEEELVGQFDARIAPKLLVTVGARGSLDLLEAIRGNPTVVAVGSEPEDPICRRAAYLVRGDVREAVEAVLAGL
ncbi:MAG TPA: FAD-binding protein [Candidatus Thermoplasmatota archaeon]|nr:FAD-binding protein [Candidatus Thermoplasmatota archaeon]